MDSHIHSYTQSKYVCDGCSGRAQGSIVATSEQKLNLIRLTYRVWFASFGFFRVVCMAQCHSGFSGSVCRIPENLVLDPLHGLFFCRLPVHIQSRLIGSKEAASVLRADIEEALSDH